MEENNYRHEEFDDCFLCRHPALKHVLVGLLVFWGAFAAFYVVADWHFKRMSDPVVQMRLMDRAFQQQERQIDRIAQKDFRRAQKMDSAPFVKVDKNKDAYRIVIDLRPFDNDEKNVEISTSGNTVMINAAGAKNSRKGQEIMRYSQAFAFGENIDAENITRVRQGNEYIITIPFD